MVSLALGTKKYWNSEYTWRCITLKYAISAGREKSGREVHHNENFWKKLSLNFSIWNVIIHSYFYQSFISFRTDSSQIIFPSIASVRSASSFSSYRLLVLKLKLYAWSEMGLEEIIFGFHKKLLPGNFPKVYWFN